MDQNDVYAFSSGDEGPDDPNDQLNPAAEALLTRCNALLGEVESFQRSLRRAKVERTVELRLFMNQVKAEQRAIQGVCNAVRPSCADSGLI